MNYGYLGVEAFFVLSGFIIPWTIWKSTYALKDFPIFLTKRFVRLHPPFLIAIAATLVLNLVSSLLPGFRGEAITLRSASGAFICDSLYLTGLLGRDWVIVASWTLAIEVQFYVLSGLLLLIMAPKNGALNSIVLMILLVPCLVLSFDGRFLFHYLPLFVLGWSAAVFWYGSTSIATYTAAVFSVFVSFQTLPTPSVIAALLTFSLILWGGELTTAPLEWLGKISYSVYLLHVPIGGRIINFSERFPEGTFPPTIVFLVATFSTIISGYFFWRWIEQPFHLWSRLIGEPNRRDDLPGKSARRIADPR